MKVCFIGGGNIAQAIIEGMLKVKLPPKEIIGVESKGVRIAGPKEK